MLSRPSALPAGQNSTAEACVHSVAVIPAGSAGVDRIYPLRVLTNIYAFLSPFFFTLTARKPNLFIYLLPFYLLLYI